METRLPVEGSFGNQFSLNYNRCGVMAAWSRKTLKNRNFWGLLATSVDVFCSNFVKFGRRQIGKIVCCLSDKNTQNFDWLSSSRCCADRTQSLPGPAPRMYSQYFRLHPNQFAVGGIIPERMNNVKTGRKVFPIFGWSLASSRIVNKNSSGDEIANVNFYAVCPEATRISWNNAK